MKSIKLICKYKQLLAGTLLFSLFFGFNAPCLNAQSSSDKRLVIVSEKTRKPLKMIHLDQIHGQAVVALEDVKWPISATGLKIALLDANGALIKTVTSGAGGKFDIKEVAFGNYTLKVDPDEMHPLSVGIRLTQTFNAKTPCNCAIQLILRLKTDKKESAANVITNSRLRLELLDRVGKDQEIRQEIIQSKEFEPNSKIVNRISEMGAQNEARMAAIIKEYGFPSPTLVGIDGVEAAFLLVQHASHAFQKKNHPVILKAYRAGKLSGQNYALFLDRVLVGDGEPQIYGTQAKSFTDWANQEPVLLPIKDEASVDQRRKSIGLPPLSEYLKTLKQMYFPAEKSNP